MASHESAMPPPIVPTRGKPWGPALSLGLALLGAIATAAPAELHDPGCGEIDVVMRADVVIYPLARSFIRAGTDSVALRDQPWRRGVDYVLDGLRGELRLLREPAPGETLRVKACWLIAPPPLELQILRYRPVSVAASESLAGADRGAGGAFSARPLASRNPFESPAGASLALTGNKTIAVDFGSNQDAFLRQSLDLTVSGRLAPGVELTGVLSDRNTPLTAGGSTQNLESLDRVLIELKAPNGNAALGDVGLTLTQGEFARLERRLQGVRGQWTASGVTATAAAASAPGEFYRLQFFGVEGRQGPYQLTDRDGGTGISVVAGSEAVTLDGARMTRGEGADYAIDYDRARITFSNRRLISSSSRITVEYQYSVNRYRRNLVAAGGRWEKNGLFAYAQALNEDDDRGRPLDVALSADDRARLEAAGDSSSRALGQGVAAGGGDYDTVRVGAQLVYVFVGRDSGQFAVQFARVNPGGGEYAESGVVAGRTVYQYVGPGKGAYQVGRPLPLPEAHRLWAVGGGTKLGVLSVEVEGAVSHLDRNLFSRLEDGDDRGEAGRASVRLEGRTGGFFPGVAGIEVVGRTVGERFAPFGRLERPFAEEDWGLPVNGDLEHQRRVGVTGFFRPRSGGELRASVGRLSVPGGFASLRRELEWSRDGTVITHLSAERADGEQKGMAFASGGRQRFHGDLGLRLAFLEPALRAEWDERRFPSDTGRAGDRAREAGLELQSGQAVPWRILMGYGLRRDGRATAVGFVDQAQARTLRISVDSPPERRSGVALSYQRRDLEPLAAPRRTRSELGSVRLRGEDSKRGLQGQLSLEVTSEGENRRERRLTYVGAGLGGYDALGNFVGRGDYDLVVTVSPDLDRFARAATSLELGWQFGQSPEWRGSRVEFDFESEARRLGELKIGDPWVTPTQVAGDPGLARGSVLQRLETELAPGSRVGALRLRAERRVTGDRSFANFAQSQDDRNLSLRWRTRPAGALQSELEGRLRRQSVSQAISQGAFYRRMLLESGTTAQLIYTPDARLRAVAALEASWVRPETQAAATRTLRAGPDLGLAVGARGHAELSLRRSFLSGPPALALLPSADPVGPPEWEGSARLDYRVREAVNLGMSVTGRDRRERTPQYTGRAELRAFF